MEQKSRYAVRKAAKEERRKRKESEERLAKAEVYLSEHKNEIDEKYESARLTEDLAVDAWKTLHDPKNRLPLIRYGFLKSALPDAQ